MSKSRRRENNLSTAIKKGISVQELLSSDELAITVRNEVPEFIEFIFPSNEMKKETPNLTNLEKLIKLSLEPDEEQKQRFKLYQLSRNAANMFSNPSRKLHEMLRKDNSKRYFKSLRQFIFNKNNRNPMFAGHFQRMFEMALRNSGKVLVDKSYNDGFEDKFIPFIIKNSDLLPYKELLSVIMSEFYEYFPTCIDETLRYAAISTLHIDEDADTDQLFMQSARNVYPNEKLEKEREAFIRSTQPQNCQKQPIEIPYFICPIKFRYQSNYLPDDQEFINTIKADLSYDDLKSSDISHSTKHSTDIDNKLWINFALNLIYAVKNAYEMDIDNIMVNKVKQEEREGKESNIVKCLLICGMYADSDSPLSYTSFNLLFNLLNEPHKDSNGAIDDKYILNLKPPKIVDQYAEHFLFDPYEITERMVSGLLIFWNHRYTDLPNNEDNSEEKKSLPNYTPKEGISPLELLLPSVLTEPICSSKLNNIFMRIISSMEQEIIDTINKEKSFNNQNQSQNQNQTQTQDQLKLRKSIKKCFKLDCIWYELLTYKFKLLPNDEETVTLQKALEKLLPLPTTDDFYHKKLKENQEIKMFRAPTNPVFFMLSNIINHGAFFSFKKGLEFRELFTETVDRNWAFNAFTYYHIIDKMQKNLIELNYSDTHRIKKRKKLYPKCVTKGSDDEDNTNKDDDDDD